MCYSSLDFASDAELGRSVTGYIIYVRGVPISWRSIFQRSVTLSSPQAGWIALSEAVKVIMFVLQLLEAVNIKVHLSVIVQVDNVGARSWQKNITTSSGVKHVDICTKHINKYVTAGILKILFVTSKEHISDIFTMNLGSIINKKYLGKFIMSKDKLNA